MISTRKKRIFALKGVDYAKKRSRKEQGSDYMFVAGLKFFARLNRCGIWKKIER